MTSAEIARAHLLRRTATDTEHKLWLQTCADRNRWRSSLRAKRGNPFVAAKLECRGASRLAMTAHGSIGAVCETIVAALDGQLEPYDRYSRPSSALSGTFSPLAGARTLVSERQADEMTLSPTLLDESQL